MCWRYHHKHSVDIFTIYPHVHFLDGRMAHIYKNVVDIRVNHHHTMFVYVFWIHLHILYGATIPRKPELPYFRGSMITRTRATLGRTPLDEGLVWRTGVNLTTNRTHKRGRSMLLTGFEVVIPARPQTRTLDHAATGIAIFTYLPLLFLALKRD